MEANKRNYSELLENTASLHDVECVNVAAGREKGKLRFEMDDAKNSYLCDDGRAVVDADTIDNILHGRDAAFVKMDIEGAECDAILGMKDTIKRCRPALAVCVYHKAEDLFRVPLLIDELGGGGYDMFLRHYSPTMIESVLYAAAKTGDAAKE